MDFSIKRTGKYIFYSFFKYVLENIRKIVYDINIHKKSQCSACFLLSAKGIDYGLFRKSNTTSIFEVFEFYDN